MTGATTPTFLITNPLPGNGMQAPVLLQRGDVVFVPKSSVGNGIEWVDLYLNQLIPFTKSIGIGASYRTA